MSFFLTLWCSQTQDSNKRLSEALSEFSCHSKLVTMQLRLRAYNLLAFMTFPCNICSHDYFFPEQSDLLKRENLSFSFGSPQPKSWLAQIRFNRCLWKAGRGGGKKQAGWVEFDTSLISRKWNLEKSHKCQYNPTEIKWNNCKAVVWEKWTFFKTTVIYQEDFFLFYVVVVLVSFF